MTGQMSNEAEVKEC